MRISQGRRRACPRTRSRKRAGPGPPAPPLLQVGQHRQRNPAAGPEQRAPGQIRRVCLRQRPRLIGPQIPLAPPQRGGEIGQQPQRVPLTLRQGQEHLPGRRFGEPGREQRETALVAADDAELLTGEPGQPLPRNTAGLQQINKPIPARAGGDLLANAPDEVGSELAGPASHANTLPRVSQPGPAAPAVGGATTAVIPAARRPLRCRVAHHGARLHRRLAAATSAAHARPDGKGPASLPGGGLSGWPACSCGRTSWAAGGP